jgi:hypothetical protein
VCLNNVDLCMQPTINKHIASLEILIRYLGIHVAFVIFEVSASYALIIHVPVV